MSKTHVSIVKLHELMLRLGFEWSEQERNWMPPEEPITQMEVIEIIRLYEEDR
jgi:hypothetical protein